MTRLRVRQFFTALTLLWVLSLASCSTLNSVIPGYGYPAKLAPEKVGPTITKARADLAAGDSEEAMMWMQAAVATSGLPPAQKREARELLEDAARARILELSQPPIKPKKLAGFLELELPRQIAVEATLIAADEYNRRGDSVDSFRLIKKLDQKFPTHHLRSEAGRVLADAGLEIAKDDSYFLFIFPRRARAKEVLEYLVLNYPSEKRCDQAYATLAWLYEQEENWERAVERHQDLLLYHPASPIATASEARIPQLRLISITSPEYDRQELSGARDELTAWLERHAGHELEESVRLDLAECYLRLHESDMGIARFYKRVDNPFGARFHATRASEEARLAGDSEREAAALAYVEALPLDEYRPPLSNPSASGGSQ